MREDHHRVFGLVGLLLGLNWISLLFVEASTSLLGGYFLGSLFAQLSLAAAWMAFGPAPIWRVPLSFLWAISLPYAISIKLGYAGMAPHRFVDIGSIVLGCLIGQWLFLQISFLILAFAFGLRIRHMDIVQNGSSDEAIRFGIRHLLIVMVLLSVILGVGRIIVYGVYVLGEGDIVVTLAIAAIVMTVPLLLTCLMRRFSIAGISLAIVLSGVATAVTATESPLSRTVGFSRADLEILIATNVSSAIVILVVAGILRLNGYCLCVRPASGNA